MFESATLKLTGWYLLIIMVINLAFSIVIYETTTSELSSRLDMFGQGIRSESSDTFYPSDLRQIRDSQTSQAKRNIIVNLIYSNVIILAAGGVVAYILARRTLRPIEQSHKAQSQFTSDASHELRTPLAAMKAELEASLRDTQLTKGEMRELLTSNLEEVDKLTSLSETLLKLARQDYTGLKQSKLSLETAIKSAAALHDKTGRRIKLIAPVKPLFVYGHQPSIEELFMILIDNALKYSPAGSSVQVKLSRLDKQARVEVINTGKGISAENLPYIFDRFYRADNARSGEGHGLGLSLAKTIVQIHHGELSVSSAPHSDTTFTVLLPLFKATKRVSGDKATES